MTLDDIARLRAIVASGTPTYIGDTARPDGAAMLAVFAFAPDLLALAERAALVDAVRRRWPEAVSARDSFGDWCILRYSDHGIVGDAPSVGEGPTEEAAWRAALAAAPAKEPR